MDVSKLTNEIRGAMKDQPSIKLAFIFGSFAQGRARGDSDIDVAVASDRPLTYSKKIELIEYLATRTGRPVDLIDLQQAEGLILNQILTTGRRIVCKDSDLYARLIMRMIMEQEDVMPYHRRILTARRMAWIGA